MVFMVGISPQISFYHIKKYPHWLSIEYTHHISLMNLSTFIYYIPVFENGLPIFSSKYLYKILFIFLCIRFLRSLWLIQNSSYENGTIFDAIFFCMFLITFHVYIFHRNNVMASLTFISTSLSLNEVLYSTYSLTSSSFKERYIKFYCFSSVVFIIRIPSFVFLYVLQSLFKETRFKFIRQLFCP
jgi:hypothetical protein